MTETEARSELADRQYFKIGDVERLTGVQDHVLRYWETEFSQLRPRKTRSGHRIYTRRDIELVDLIRHLLYEERFSYDGVRQQLERHDRADLEQRVAADGRDELLRDIRSGLEDLRERLEGRDVSRTS